MSLQRPSDAEVSILLDIRRELNRSNLISCIHQAANASLITMRQHGELIKMVCDEGRRTTCIYEELNKAIELTRRNEELIRQETLRNMNPYCFTKDDKDAIRELPL